ncbi:unnamed protein product [Moneuplotes crassus]|uniref:Uncharacterized protein n=2 Tax=Euplotes crassus TaxID=5936 RepID=A0AAD1XU18_EUPCR|nr:unnamed protein product [Moneuplotes crassus]
MDLYMKYLEAETAAFFKGDINAVERAMQEIQQAKEEENTLSDLQQEEINIMIAALELLNNAMFEKPINYAKVDQDFRKYVLEESSQEESKDTLKEVYPGIMASYYFQAAAFMSQKECETQLQNVCLKLYQLVKDKSNFENEQLEKEGQDFNLEQLCWRYIILLPCFEDEIFIKECKFEENLEQIIETHNLSEDQLVKDSYNITLYIRHDSGKDTLDLEKRKEIFNNAVKEIERNPSFLSLKSIYPVILTNFVFLKENEVLENISWLTRLYEDFKGNPDDEHYSIERNNNLDILIETLKVISKSNQSNHEMWKIYKEICVKIQSKIGMEDDYLNDSLVTNLNSLALLKLTEVSQDDIYELYLKYAKFFKLKTEEDKIRLKYLKPSFVSKLIQIFKAINIRFNEKLIENYLKVKREVGEKSYDFIRMGQVQNLKYLSLKDREDILKLVEEYGFSKDSFTCKNVIHNFIREGINSTDLVFKSKASILLKERLAYIRPRKKNGVNHIELTNLYQMLLAKAKVDMDTQTYKELSMDTINLLITSYPQNPDILTTFQSLAQIYLAEKDKDKFLEIGRECYNYCKKYIEPHLQEYTVGVLTYSQALFENKDYKKASEILLEIQFNKRNASEEHNYNTLLLKTLCFVDIAKADDIKEANKARIMEAYDGKINFEVVDFIENYGTNLHNAGQLEKALDQYEEAKQLQKKYKGEASVKYKEIECNIKRLKVIKEVKENQASKQKQKKIILTGFVLALTAIGGYLIYKKKKDE